MQLNQMFAHWEQVRDGLLATIDKFSEEELDYISFQSSWPAGQIMLHIADCEDNWLHGVVRGEFEPWVFYDLKDYPTKKAIRDLLEAAHRRTLAYLPTLDESNLSEKYATPSGRQYAFGWIIWHVLEHEIHHRGELSLMLGILGKEGLDV